MVSGTSSSKDVAPTCNGETDTSAKNYKSVRHYCKEGVCVQDVVVPEGVREGLTRGTESLELELEGHGQIGNIHVREGPLQAGNTTQQRPDASQSKAWRLLAEVSQSSWGWRRRCGVKEDEAIPSSLALGLGKTLHSISKEIEDQRDPVTVPVT